LFGMAPKAASQHPACIRAILKALVHVDGGWFPSREPGRSGLHSPVIPAPFGGEKG